MRRFLSVLTCCIALPAHAQVILPGSCYLRQYTRAHLAEHPDQTVTMIALGPETGAEEADAPILRLMVAVRGDGEFYRATAYCDGWGRRMDCMLEGDAGGFTLEPARDGAVRMTLARYGITFEGSGGFVTLEGDRGDDRVFLIPAVPADACP
jgi:predicted nucleic acid-binding Zn ribbon protein